MKKKLCLFMVLFLFQYPLFAAEKLILSSPQTSGATDIAFHVLREAYSRIGIDVQRKILPAERALLESNAGRTAGEVMRELSITKNYPNLVQIPVPVMKIKFVVVTRDKLFKVDGWDSIRPYKIGIMKGIKFVEAKTKGMNTEISSAFDTVLKKVNVGRTDIAVITSLSAINLIKKHGMTDLKILEPPIAVINLFHFLHKDRRDLIPRITATLKEMEETGTLDEIIQKAQR